MVLKTPGGLAEHEPKFKPDAWKAWSVQELGGIVAFFLKRATHRLDPEKRAKDLTDAQNYAAMIQAHIDAAKAEE